jgi:uncharacterized protein (TIGR03435 family)
LAVIRRAYNVQSHEIIGPTWLSAETYEIQAKLPPDPELSERYTLIYQFQALSLPVLFETFLVTSNLR